MLVKPLVYRALAPVALLASAALFVIVALVLVGACRRVVLPGQLGMAEARSAVFRVCADRDELPFSSARDPAFEKLLVSAGCDAIAGVPLRRTAEVLR